MIEIKKPSEEIIYAQYCYAVYLLRDPRDSKVYYVGMTKNVKGRYTQHANGASPCGGKMERWMNEVRVRKLKPIMEVVAQNLTFEIASVLEAALMKHYSDLDMPLINTNIPKALEHVSRRFRSEPLLDHHRANWSQKIK